MKERLGPGSHALRAERETGYMKMLGMSLNKLTDGQQGRPVTLARRPWPHNKGAMKDG